MIFLSHLLVCFEIFINKDVRKLQNGIKLATMYHLCRVGVLQLESQMVYLICVRLLIALSKGS